MTQPEQKLEQEPDEPARRFLRLPGADGLRLAADSYGPESGRPVILLGGLGQTRQSWQRAARRIASGGRRAITVDLRGHGDSDWSVDASYRFAPLAADLASVVAATGGSALVAGASLGGKIALGFAGSATPGTVSGLVLVDTVPRSRMTGVANILANLRPPPEGFASPDAAALALATRRGTEMHPDAGERLRRNMRQNASGRWHWHWDPAFLDRDHGLGPAAATTYLEAAAARLAVPVLLVRGGLSDVVDDAGAAALKSLIPQLEIEVIEGARHMIVGDQNDTFADTLLRFLARHPSA